MAITLTFGQQQSVHPTAEKKNGRNTNKKISRTIDQKQLSLKERKKIVKVPDLSIQNLRYRLHIDWTSSPGCDNVFQDSTIHRILNYYPANNHFKETNRALSTA